MFILAGKTRSQSTADRTSHSLHPFPVAKIWSLLEYVKQSALRKTEAGPRSKPSVYEAV